MNTLLIDQAYLIERTLIDDNTDYSKIMPEIEKVQNLYIRPLLGTDLYNEIISQIESSPDSPYADLSVANKTLLFDYLQSIVSQYLLMKLTVLGHYKQTNSGIQTRTPDGSQAAELSTIKFLVDFKKNDAEAEADLMLKYIRANASSYPAFFTRNNANSVLPKNTGFDVDVYLPDNYPFVWPTNDTGDINHDHEKNQKPF